MVRLEFLRSSPTILTSFVTPFFCSDSDTTWMEALPKYNAWCVSGFLSGHRDVITHRSLTRIDTLKIYTRAHGAKVRLKVPILLPRRHISTNTFTQTTNLIINLDHDDWILNDDTQVLADIGFGE